METDQDHVHFSFANSPLIHCANSSQLKAGKLVSCGCCMAKYSVSNIGIKNYFGRMAISSVPLLKPHLKQYVNASFYKVNRFSITM